MVIPNDRWCHDHQETRRLRDRLLESAAICDICGLISLLMVRGMVAVPPAVSSFGIEHLRLCHHPISEPALARIITEN